MNIINYKQKYLKYKQKYLELKKLYGGTVSDKHLFFPITKCTRIDAITKENYDTSNVYLKGEIDSLHQRFLHNIQVLNKENINTVDKLNFYDCTEQTFFKNYINELNLDKEVLNKEVLNILGPTRYSFYYINNKKILLFGEYHNVLDDISEYLPFIIFLTLILNFFSEHDRCLDFFIEETFNNLTNKFTDIGNINEIGNPNYIDAYKDEKNPHTYFKTILQIRYFLKINEKFYKDRYEKCRFQKIDLRDFFINKDESEILINAFYSPVLYTSDNSKKYNAIFFDSMLEYNISKENIINNLTYLFKYMLNKIDATDTELNGKIETYLNNLHTKDNHILNVNNTKIIRDKIFKQFNSNEKKDKILDYFILLLIDNFEDIIDYTQSSKSQTLADIETNDIMDDVDIDFPNILMFDLWAVFGVTLVDIYTVGRMFKNGNNSEKKTVGNIIYYGGDNHLKNILSVFNNIISSYYKKEIYEYIYNIYRDFDRRDIFSKLPYFLENVKKVSKIELTYDIFVDIYNGANNEILFELILEIINFDITSLTVIDPDEYYAKLLSNTDYYNTHRNQKGLSTIELTYSDINDFINKDQPTDNTINFKDILKSYKT